MPRYRHPRVTPENPAQFAVQLGSEQVVLDSEGCFESDNNAAVRKLAAAYDSTVDAMRVDGDSDGVDTDTDADTETCDVVKADGEVCGRDLPCGYHSKTED